MQLDPNDPGLQFLLEKAAERGAQEALARVGLLDENSANDIRELRSLLDGWRTAKRSIVNTTMQVIVVFLLGALATGIALKIKLFGT